MIISDNSANGAKWDNFDLERGESKTVLYRFSTGLPTKADIVLAVDYEFFWMKWRWLFRFEGMHGDNWNWERQPIGDLNPGINRVIDESLMKHRRLTTRPQNPN